MSFDVWGHGVPLPVIQTSMLNAVITPSGLSVFVADNQPPVLPALPPKADIGSPCTKHENKTLRVNFRRCGTVYAISFLN